MRMRDVVRALLGGCVVYVLVAACAGSDNARSVDGAAGGVGAGGTAHDGGLLDALADPVGEASAGEPDVATESCDKTFNEGTMPYAEHSYSGKSVTDLAGVIAIVQHESASAAPSGYGRFTTYVWLADGKVAAPCVAAGDTVTFVLPAR